MGSKRLIIAAKHNIAKQAAIANIIQLKDTKVKYNIANRKAKYAKKNKVSLIIFKFKRETYLPQVITLLLQPHTFRSL